ncbi:MAG: TetR family transcriptional regulator [Actinomycetota bacterium]
MPRRSAEETRSSIIDAAIREFASFGLAGARVERIAAAAGVNPKTLYSHFAGKDALFAAAIDTSIEHAHESVPFRPDDLAGYAADLFDYVVDNPEIAMIDAWRRLERPDPTPAEQRHYDEKLRLLRETPHASDGSRAPADVLVTVLAVASMWFSAPQALGERSDRDRQRRREMVVETVTRIVSPE